MWKTAGMNKGRAKRFGVASAAVIAVMVSGPPAQAADLSIPIDTTIDGGIAEGQQASLATVATVDLEGATCDVRAVRTGGAETNAGNDLVVSSGGDSTTLVDVERQPDAVTDGGMITLGPTLSVTVVMGEDEQFSAAISVELDCGLPAVTSAPTTAASTAASADVAADAASSASPTGESSTTSTLSDLPNTGVGATIGSLIATALVFFGALMVIGARRPATP